MTTTSFFRRLVVLFAACALGALVLVGSATGAGAQDNSDYTAKPVPVSAPRPGPAAQVRSAAGDPVPSSAVAEPVGTRWLAVTGTDVAGLVLLGTVLLGSGMVLLLVRRRAAGNDT